MSDPDFTFQGYGTGALPLPEDYRDYQLACIPGVNAVLNVGAPPEYDLSQHFKQPALNQGATSACVAFSTCHMMMMFEQMERQQWIPLSGSGLYAANGGTGSNGVPTREVLQYCSTQGAWAEGNPQKRWKIKNYAFVSMRAQSDVEIVKAAVASGRPVVLAWLLPTDFSGWSSGAAVAGIQSYHQTVIAKYTGERFFGPNSWGSGWGGGNGLPAGWYSAPWEFLFRSQQQGLVYCYSVEDAPDEGTDPTPLPVLVIFTGPATAKVGQSVTLQATLSAPAPAGGAAVTVSGFPALTSIFVPAGQVSGSAVTTVPQTPAGTKLVLTGSYGGGTFVHVLTVEGSVVIVNRVRVAGRIEGQGAGQLSVGRQLLVSGDGFSGTLSLTQITPDDDTPSPDVLKVTGYSRNPVKAGASFDIYGTGFLGGNVFVTWGSQTLQAERISGTAIAAIAPANPGQNPVQVRVEGAAAVGPILTVEAGTEPPVGDVAVKIEYQMRLGRNVWVYASATEGGQPVSTTMNLFVDGAPVQNGVRNVPAGSQGRWGVRQPAQATFKVTATSVATGKSGEVSRVV